MRVLLLLSALLSLTVSQGYAKRVICYYTNWGELRPGEGRFSVQDIDPNLCTHIIYSFAKVQGNGLAITEGTDPERYRQIIALKQRNPKLKVMLAVGGWTHGSEPFTQMVATDQSQREFVENSYKYMKQYGFDGLDLDWEYPADRGSPPEDRQRFTQLTEKLSAKYKPEGLLLSAATPAYGTQYDRSYEAQVCNHLDFINMMTYDFGGHWDNTALHNSALSAQRQTVEHMLRKPGCTAEKLNLGMGAYGRTHKLASPSSNQIGASTIRNSGMAGTYTREAGFLSYYEVCQKLKEGWKREWSSQQEVPYAYHGSDWVGYDDRESIRLKATYVKDMNLGGAMFWAMDLDDFRGTACGEGKYPLINAAKEIVNGNQVGTIPTTTLPAADQTPTAAAYCVNSKEKQTYANVSNNCQSFYDCLTTPSGKQITVPRACPSPLIYVEETMKCTKLKDIVGVQHKCSTSLAIPVASLGSVYCPNASALVPDTSCRFHTDCSSKSRYQCPPDTSFDKASKQCVPKQSIQCW